MRRHPQALHALNTANADAQLDDLLHQYFRLATPPTSASGKRRLKRPLPASDNAVEPATPESALKRLKAFLKDSSESDKHIQRVLDALRNQLRKAPRQRAVLPLAVRLARELFARSALFRARVAAQAAAFFTQLLEAAGEKDVAMRRPRGQAQSEDVRAVLALIESWSEQFGAKYPTLVAGHAGLVDVGYVFPRVRETTACAEREAAERLRHQASVRQLQVQKMEREMATRVPEMETTIVEMDNIFEILVPTLEAFELDETNAEDDGAPTREADQLPMVTAHDGDDDAVEWEDVPSSNGEVHASGQDGPAAHDEEEDDSVEWEDVDDAAVDPTHDEYFESNDDDDETDDMDINDIVRAYGLGSSSYQLTISIPTTVCEKSAENEVLFRSLADGVLQIRKRFLPLVSDWLQIADGDAVALEQPRDAALLRQLHDLRRRLEGATLKWEDLVKESERKQFARIRPRVVTLPLAAFDGRGVRLHKSSQRQKLL